MHVSARADFALRAVVELARHDGPVKCRDIAAAQDVPMKFLVNIMTDLRRAKLVRSARGADGGYWLARAAADVTVLDVLVAVDGPLVTVRGEEPPDLVYPHNSRHLHALWQRVDDRLTALLGAVSIDDVVTGSGGLDTPDLLAPLDAASPVP